MALFTRSTQYELWADLATQNRHLRLFNWVLFCAVLGLAVGMALMALKPMVAISVDQLGRAEVVEALASGNDPRPEEAQHIAELVASYLLEVTSNSVARDIAKALALMTPDFAHAYAAEVRKDPKLALYEQGSIRTTLTFDSNAADIRVERDSATNRVVRYLVTLGAKLEVFSVRRNTAPLLTEPLRVRVGLLAVPRSPKTLNGLLVEYFEKEVIEPPRPKASLGAGPLQPASSTPTNQLP